MKRFALVVAGFLAGAVLALQVPSTAQPSGTAADTTQRTITVTGTATIHAQPDEAVVSLGVRTQAATAQAAMQQNAQKMTAVLDAMHKLGIGGADLATTNVALDPVYSNGGNAVIGFQAMNQLEVTVHDMNAVGGVIDAAVAAGANLAGGITFQLSDRNQGVNDALAKAVQHARSKADAMAAAADATVGDVVTIQEGTTPTPVRYAVPQAAEGVATPVNPPTIETSVQVTVTWALA
ncbi:MAG: SIMPL domain-containing protein [Planctomycetaceae bacterium]